MQKIHLKMLGAFDYNLPFIIKFGTKQLQYTTIF